MKQGQDYPCVAKDISLLDGAADGDNGIVGVPPARQALHALDNPKWLSLVGTSFEFLDSAKLHYCEHCDEEWVVFAKEFPQAGKEYAGHYAGICQTINELKFGVAELKDKEGNVVPLPLCTRCQSKTGQYGVMFSAKNLQHLGPRHEALSKLTHYEELLVARVHPVISVVTLVSTGLLSYAGHVVNYFVKTMEWLSDLPVELRQKNFFLVRRRRSICRAQAETSKKKPTTANRDRIVGALKCLLISMPRIYKTITLNRTRLAAFPIEGEREMDEEDVPADLSGEVAVPKDSFLEWMSAGIRSREQYPCAQVLWRHANNLQSGDTGAVVDAGITWEVFIRFLEKDTERTKTVGSHAIASYIVYLLASNEHGPLQDDLYDGMVAEAESRGKTLVTDGDHEHAQLRWIRQQVHGELDLMRERFLENRPDAEVELEVEGDIAEPKQPVARLEKEHAAASLLTELAQEVVAAGQAANSAAGDECQVCMEDVNIQVCGDNCEIQGCGCLEDWDWEPLGLGKGIPRQKSSS